MLITVQSDKPKIAWVSFHPGNDTPSAAARSAGFTRAADAAYTDALEDAGFEVTRIVTSGTPNAAMLNLFDLVIISRSVPSGDYETAAETLAWNSITAPTMIMGGYVIRANRLGFSSGNTIPDTEGPVKLNVLDPDHPIFEGVSLDASGVTVNNFADSQTFNGTLQRGISVVTDEAAAGGTVLATVAAPGHATDAGMIIGEWKAGATMANAAGDTLAGDRLIFLSGSRENDGLTSEGAGIFDLSEDGEKMFLNAVAYMTDTEPPADRPELEITRNAQGISISFTGTLQSTTDIVNGTWTDVTSISPYTTSPTDPKRFYRAKQ